MDVSLQQQLDKIWAEKPYKMVLSAPRAGQKHRRAVFSRINEGWQLELFTETQVFHQNLEEQALPKALQQQLEEAFTQLHAFAGQQEYSLRISKKGKVLAGHRKTATPPKEKEQHNRGKAALLPEGSVVPPLVDMGIFTAQGTVVAAMYDKYRQINRFVELVEDALKGRTIQKLSVVDFGCGKSYLSFILYHYLTAVRGIDVQMTGLDLKADVVAACNAAAQKYGYHQLRFQVGDIAGWRQPQPVDMVLSLHACDTATDAALAGAVAMGAEMIFSVPCCQHELNGQMESEELSILTRYGLVKERTAALMTDAVRANLLQACGYKTQLVEFVDFEHTPKNILIRAVRAAIPAAKKRQMLAEVRRLTDAFSLRPSLLDMLQQAGSLPPD